MKNEHLNKKATQLLFDEDIGQQLLSHLERFMNEPYEEVSENIK